MNLLFLITASALGQATQDAVSQITDAGQKGRFGDCFGLSQHRREKIAGVFLGSSSAHQQMTPSKWLASSCCASCTALSPVPVSYHWTLARYASVFL